uniref:Ig-like domain-containing protein n=1 Tax=Cyprinus carpio TaxID=7962 RepID=A0A8C2IW22_CYPCA
MITSQGTAEDLQFSGPANGAVGGSVVFAPDNPPSTSTDSVLWLFESTPILSVQSGSTVIFSAYRDRVSFDINTLALELRNLRLDDSGTYKLTVAPSAGAQLTGETTLQVYENITDVRLIGPEESLIEGESSVNISSEGTGSILSVQWMKDNSPLSPSNSIIFSSDNRSVSISPVQRSDSGEYQCTYRNPVSSETAKLNLIINCECSTFKHQDDLSSNLMKYRHSSVLRGGGGGGGLSSGAIAGIVIGVLVAVAGICGLIVYLTKTKKIHFQKASGGRVNLGNKSEFSTEYAEVKHGGKSSAPPPPYGHQVSSCDGGHVQPQFQKSWDVL